MKKIIFAFLLLIPCLASAQITTIDSIISGGIYRNFRVYTPAAYTGVTAYPLVFDLHGYTSSASAEQAYSNFMPIADTAHFILVYPNGTLLSGQPYWNAGFGPGVNDIQFISDLIDSISATYNIDPNSIYSCGMSNGGYMSHTLACALNNRIAAIASVTGTMATTQYATCSPGRPVPVMQVSGTGDGTVNYYGSAGNLPIDTLVNYWVTNNNCNPTAAFSNVPDINTTDGCTAEHYVWSGGDMGSSVELYKIIGGGHTWPGSPFTVGVTNRDFKASEKIWIFFRKYHLNQFVGVQDLGIQDVGFRIYPNPANDMITIDGKDISKVSIFDLNGKIVLSATKNQVDISGLANGIYSVVIVTKTSHVVKKLVKI